MKDMHSNIKVVHAITPQAVGTTGAANGKLSEVIDRQGYESVEFAFSSGASASTADTITPIVYESDTATSADFTAVDDADLLGTEDAQKLTLAAAGSSKIGYRGNKRYVGLRLYGVGTATAIVSAVAVLGNPHQAPVA
jgi:hypothetical protein